MPNDEKTAVERDIESKQLSNSKQDNKTELMRAFDTLSNPEFLEGNTILTNNQVVALSVINWASQVYDIEFFKHFVCLFPRYRISGDDGRGRKELIQIAEAIQRDKQMENERLFDLLGKR